MEIQKKGIIVSFSASQWTARKLDKTVTHDVNSSYGASADAGRYNKLLVQKDKTNAIAQIVNEARAYHYKNTLCWSDNNERLLSTDLYMDYVQEMSRLQNKFATEVDVFLKEYNDIIENEKVRLSNLFNRNDYPSMDNLERKFNFSFIFMPVPETDMRVSLNNIEIEKIRKQVEAHIENMTLTAMRDIWQRIKDVLVTMRDKLSDTDSIYRDSLFTNVQELVDMLPKFNVTNNKEIAAITKEMQQIKIEPQLNRDSIPIRQQTVEQVDSILDMFKANFN